MCVGELNVGVDELNVELWCHVQNFHWRVFNCITILFLYNCNAHKHSLLKICQKTSPLECNGNKCAEV